MTALAGNHVSAEIRSDYVLERVTENGSVCV